VKARADRTGVKVSVTQGDATKLAYVRRFDSVIALYILFLLPSDEDVLKCLRGAYVALRSGGVFVCNVMNPFTRHTNWIVELIRDGRTVTETRAKGVRETEIQKLKHFDPVLGVGWVHSTGIIEAPDGVHVFRDRERFRLLTYWDMVRYLKDSNFKEIHCYPDWKIKPDKQPKAEQLALVARK
jgi:SAM-dependent methyltransferase